jgi:hypothetical protein
MKWPQVISRKNTIQRTLLFVKQLTISTFVMISSGSNEISSSAAASKTRISYYTQAFTLPKIYILGMQCTSTPHLALYFRTKVKQQAPLPITVLATETT